MGDKPDFNESAGSLGGGRKNSKLTTGVESGSPQAGALEIDPVRLRMFQQQIKDNQNFSMGILAGFVAASAGAVVWALVTYLTNYQIGFIAIGIGFLVGIAMRKFGAGIDMKFGIAGALLALYGCLAGNIFFICLAISKEFAMPLSEVISGLDFETCWAFLKVGFEPIDVLFYAMALYFGYKFSFRKITEDELRKLAI